MRDSYYFLHTRNKSVESFEGGLFIFPVSEFSEWETWTGSMWRKTSYDYNVTCHHCHNEFNLIHKDGSNCGLDYQKYFCDESCRMRWYRKKNEALSEGALHTWNKVLWDVRYCVWLWKG